jgi:hypothetical protein
MQWLSGRHLNASLARAIRNEPEIYSKGRKNLMSVFFTRQDDCADKYYKYVPQLWHNIIHVLLKTFSHILFSIYFPGFYVLNTTFPKKIT